MSDPRLLAANGWVASLELKGKVKADRFVEGELYQAIISVADILGKPKGKRVSQLLFGDMFNVLEMRDGYAFGQSVYDGYCGYVAQAALGTPDDATHWLHVPASHLYPGPHIKLDPTDALYLGSEVEVVDQEGSWSRLSQGHYVPTRHLHPIEMRDEDPVAVAESLLGTPYVWGGNSRAGIDCSGLIQIAWRACGRDCPRDSDMQEAELGAELDREEMTRGDLAFWKGHVGLMISEVEMIHANAYHMAVTVEPLDEAIVRIEAGGDGPATAFIRPNLLNELVFSQEL